MKEVNIEGFVCGIHPPRSEDTKAMTIVVQEGECQIGGDFWNDRIDQVVAQGLRIGSKITLNKVETIKVTPAKQGFNRGNIAFMFKLKGSSVITVGKELGEFRYEDLAGISKLPHKRMINVRGVILEVGKNEQTELHLVRRIWLGQKTTKLEVQFWDELCPIADNFQAKRKTIILNVEVKKFHSETSLIFNKFSKFSQAP